jgi:hypothetical protein
LLTAAHLFGVPVSGGLLAAANLSSGRLSVGCRRGGCRLRLRGWWRLARTITFIALGTALRRGELLALRWKDVQLLDGHLRVREALVKGRFTTRTTTLSSRIRRKARRSTPHTEIEDEPPPDRTRAAHQTTARGTLASERLQLLLLVVSVVFELGVGVPECCDFGFGEHVQLGLLEAGPVAVLDGVAAD